MRPSLSRLTNLDWFARVPPAVQQEVLNCLSVRQLNRGDALYRRGEPSDAFYAVVDGRIRLSGSDRSGREAILSFYEAGSWLGEVGILSGLGVRRHDAIAEEASSVGVLRTPDLLRLLDQHPALTRELLTLEARRLAVMLSAFEAWMIQTVPQRLAQRLLMMLELHGAPVEGGIAIAISLPQEVLAGLVGSTRQRIGQVMTTWARAGFISMRRGRIVVHERRAIEALLADSSGLVPITLAQLRPDR